MKITYDSEGDVLYIQLRDDVSMADGIDLEEGVLADLDEDGHIIGLEVLDASERMTPDELSKLTYEDLVSEECARLELPAVLRSRRPA